jgi:acyl-ACP thioesterase
VSERAEPDPASVSGLSALPGPPTPDERRFEELRRVQLGDVDEHGRLRLDALSRYLQDAADGDAADAGLVAAGGPWVLRRGHLRVRRWPAFREPLTVTTWCSGVGACWAERRTSLIDDAGESTADTVTTWVHIDPATGRPRRIPAGMDAVYGGRALWRRVDARLRLPAEPPPGAEVRPWPLRRADLDVMGHVNNAAALAPVVEVLGDRGVGGPMVVDLEHRAALTGSPAPTLEHAGGDELGVWLRQAGEPAFAARLHTVGR